MTYTPDVPQATQTIAFTQPIIQDNFQFVQTDGQVEHIFNGNAPFGSQAEGTHVQCSMPNQSPEVASLPSGTAGVYYVASSKPKFYDGTSHYFLGQSISNQFNKTATSVTLSNSPTTILTLPNGCAGIYWVWNLANASSNWAFGKFFISSNGPNNVIQFINLEDHNLTMSLSDNNLQGKLSSGTVSSMAYIVQYTTVP